MHKRLLYLLAFFILPGLPAIAQKNIPLYEKEAPDMLPGPSGETYDSSKGFAFKVTHPSLTIYLPEKEKATGAAVVVCPGGGYGMLVMNNEGHAIAQYFAAHGVAAFALKYRIPDDKTMKDKSIAPLQDAQRAIQFIRLNAAEWNIDTARIGIMGFSAGGHLAATAGTHFNYPVIDNKQGTNLRPSFMLLVYPVISMIAPLGHAGSAENLLGKNPSKAKAILFSNEKQVTAQTPPTFLIHAGDDKVVDVDNSIVFYEALRHNKVPAEMHIYPKGDHGFVLQWPLDDWMSLCMNWMKRSGLLQQ